MTPAEAYRAALTASEAVVGFTSPNPWVGATLLTVDGEPVTATTALGRGPHAEASVIEKAGSRARGASLYVTLEPCAHVGANPACAQTIIDAGIASVTVGIEDPDPRVSGRGIEMLRAAGIAVDFVADGLRTRTADVLAPYVKQRRTGRPFVILKMAMTSDGRIAAPDGSSKWITGPEARHDVHLLRARCDAIVVGAGTVRADDPALDVRIEDVPEQRRSPLRVVLGITDAASRVHPALTWTGNLEELLDHLGEQGHLQVLVEGGGRVAGAFHRAGLVDRYVFYLAPVLLGGSDGVSGFGGSGVSSLGLAWRGRFVDVTRFGEDVRLTLEPVDAGGR